MAVGILWVVPVFRPFLQLPVLSDFLRAEFGNHFLQAFTKVFVTFKYRRSFNAVRE